MKIAVISDLHGNLVYYPSDYWKHLWECEALFICGDTFPLHIQFDIPKCRGWLMKEFIPWATELPVEKVYIIGGNHDAYFERNEKEARKLLPEQGKITYVKNNLVEHISIQDGDTYRIFGTPYCHIYGQWPFMRSEIKLRELFNELPDDVDILFTHDAPFGVSDVCFQGWAADGEHKGCMALREAILERKPRYCFHGHLHSSNHEEELLGDTKVYNTSILDERYLIVYEPLIIRICKTENSQSISEDGKSE
jgi:Icc-related predicted phosphoesterase